MVLTNRIACAALLARRDKKLLGQDKYLSPLQAENLRTGVRRNNRIALDESSGLPSDIVDSLSDMLKTRGLKI